MQGPNRVRIDGTFGIDSRNRSEGKGGADKAKRSSASSSSQSAQLVSTHQSLIRKALEAEDIDLAAIKEAKELLQSGKLFSPEAILRAARHT